MVIVESSVLVESLLETINRLNKEVSRLTDELDRSREKVLPMGRMFNDIANLFGGDSEVSLANIRTQKDDGNIEVRVTFSCDDLKFGDTDEDEDDDEEFFINFDDDLDD